MRGKNLSKYLNQTDKGPGGYGGVPGPGSYDLPVQRDGQIVSIKGRKDDKKPEKLPGPGHYDQGTTFAGKAFTMGSRSPAMTKDFNPGPGEY